MESEHKTFLTLKKLDVSKKGYFQNHRWLGLKNIRQVQRQAIGMELLEAVHEMLSYNNTLGELYLFEWNLIGPAPVS